MLLSSHIEAKQDVGQATSRIVVSALAMGGLFLAVGGLTVETLEKIIDFAGILDQARGTCFAVSRQRGFAVVSATLRLASRR